ncbi:MAG TPA: lytic murein transglycosylase, partial [Acidimicrobiales bacterium]|nr:lytic murein transglycosylase [Acidimicrobiales bacterium]
PPPGAPAASPPGSPPPPPAPSTPASGTVGPGGSAGPPSGFGGGQLLRLLQESAARRQNLDGRLRELQERMGRLEGELAAAQATLFEAQGEQQEIVARAAATAFALARIEAEVRQVLASRREEQRPVEIPTLRPIGINVQSGLLALPARPKDPGQSGAGSAADVRSLDELVSWQRELSEQGRRQAQELVEAQTRTTAADQAVTAALGPLEAERAVLADLRRELSAALTDPTVMLQGRSLSGAEMARPSQFALADIPPEYLELYQRAATTCPGLSWTVLAAIGSIESSHGRSTAPGVREGANFAGAMGPMQFLGPTWAAYGVDGNKDGKRDVYFAGDAVLGAANYLCASGAGDPARLPDAIWAYNHADWYVDQVLVLALRYGAGGLELLEASAADVAQLLANPNLTLSPNARADLRDGLVDQRVVNALAAMVANHRISVSVIKTGHSQFVAGTDRISNHFHGRGIDITAVDGAPVNASNDRALDLALAILTAAPSLRPDEFGSPWPGLSEFPGAFTDAAHQGHLHLGWR